MCQTLQTLLNAERVGMGFGKVSSLSSKAAQAKCFKNDHVLQNPADMASGAANCIDSG
jgi:hypothetical protein